MKFATVVVGALLAAMSLLPSDADAQAPRRRGGHHRPWHPVHRPAHPIHRPAHPIHRPPARPVHPIHRPLPGGVHRPPFGGGRRPVAIGPGFRPVNPWWRPGGAVAAGAALGFIAASAATWAGPPPGPTYCWFYTDPSRTKGFWDICPN